ncbi:hypothetical protein FQA47_006122 [Oryzias melastigma]|uniref:Uncharacterized protein n=1 Tax=Oryzias melastigma TaxID=30732 RepID=A0A834C0H7_ORYME|nr:hypothetical protein FQA47_006122 [Oryzias melastigma]
MTPSSPARLKGGYTLARPIPVPTLTVLPPSSDTESWSRSPSPRLSRLSRTHRSRTRTRKQAAAPAERAPSPMEVTGQGQDSPSHELLLPPPRSCSRSPSPSRRSRWSLRSLLSRDSDWDISRSVVDRRPSASCWAAAPPTEPPSVQGERVLVWVQDPVLKLEEGRVTLRQVCD